MWYIWKEILRKTNPANILLQTSKYFKDVPSALPDFPIFPLENLKEKCFGEGENPWIFLFPPWAFTSPQTHLPILAWGTTNSLDQIPPSQITGEAGQLCHMIRYGGGFAILATFPNKETKGKVSRWKGYDCIIQNFGKVNYIIGTFQSICGKYKY